MFKNPLFCGETIAEESHYPLPESGTIVSKTDLTEKEIREIYDRLGMTAWYMEDDIAAEIEDDYGNLQHEISFDGLTVDEDKLAQYINDLKEKYGLLSAPSLPREAIVVIGINSKVLDKKKIIKAICSIDVRGYDYVASEFEEGRYSLADILFSARFTPAPDEAAMVRSRDLPQSPLLRNR